MQWNGFPASELGYSSMGNFSPTRIFPLHLSPIERFLLDDDCESHPMAFVIKLEFSGVVVEDVFRSAMLKALHRHPLLISRLGPAKNKAECWLKPDGMLPVLDIAGDEEPIRLPKGERIDLTKEVGLRVWVRQGESTSYVVMQFHHACCDGVGAYRFIGDVLAFYAEEIDGQLESTVPSIDVKRLRHRADRCRFLSRGAKTAELVRNSINDGFKIIGRGCTALAVNRANKEKAPNPFPGYSVYTFSSTEFNELRAVSKNLGLMLNDLLILELFQAMHFWNSQVRGRNENGRYRIMMPVDLRSTDDFETPAANVIGYTFLSRSGSDLEHRGKLAASIREETAGIKHHRLGERFNDMVAVADGVRFFKKFAMRLPRALCTAVLSNVGDPSRRFLSKFERRGGCVVAGNLVLQRISGTPPVRKRSRASFSIVTYRRELTISVRCDPFEFSKADSDHLLKLYIASLRQHLKDSTPVEPEAAQPAALVG